MRTLVICVALSIFAPTLAVAQGDAGDVIELANGGRLRGMVLEYEPGRPVTIRLPSGETRVLSPEEVREVRLAGGPTSGDPATPASEHPASEPQTSEPPAPAPGPAPPATAVHPSPTGISGGLASPSAAALIPSRTVMQRPPASRATRPASWQMDDGQGADVPWRDFDPAAGYQPDGIFHLGVQVTLGGALPMDYDLVEGAIAGVAGIVDVRNSQQSPWHFRFVGELSYQHHEDRARPSGSVTYAGGTALHLRVFPFAVDLGNYVALRFGGEINAQLAGPTFELGYAFLNELGVRVLDGHLEIGMTTGVQIVPVLQEYSGFGNVSHSAQFIFLGRVDYLFL